MFCKAVHFYNCISLFLFWIIQEAIHSPYSVYQATCKSWGCKRASESSFFVSSTLPTIFFFIFNKVYYLMSWKPRHQNSKWLAKVMQEIWDGEANIWLLLISEPALKPLDILLNFQSLLALLPMFWANSSTTLYLFFPAFVNKANLAR